MDCEKRTMQTGRQRLAAAVVAGLCLAATLASEAPDSGNLPLRVVPAGPWTEAANGYLEYDRETLFDLINGGAEYYTSRGMRRGVFQKLATADGHTCEALIMDFGDSSKGVFAARRGELDTVTALAGFDTTSAFARRLPGATMVYARVDRWYIELTLTGHETPAESLADGRKMVKALRRQAGRSGLRR